LKKAEKLGALEELRKIVTQFRRGLLGKRSSKDMCYAVCLPLQGFLAVLGYETELVEGELYDEQSHFWLKLRDGTIIDPTADQFGIGDGVYIGPKPEMYRENGAGRATAVRGV
jgi:hypothetical protein